MALGDVFIKDVDGKLAYSSGVTNDKITGLLFDVSAHPTLFTAGYGKNNESKLKLNDIAYITSRKSAINDFGIIERVDASAEEEDNLNFMHGIPYYHISEFFRMSGNVDGNGKLYVMFADCSNNWDAIETLQRAAGGSINQLGIYTEQSIWKTNGSNPKYDLNLVSAVNSKAVALAEQNQPLSVILAPNCSNNGAVGDDGKKIDLNKIPTCIGEFSRTSVVFGQARNEKVSTMQKRNITNAPVGFIGAVMGAIAKASVHESIAWVKLFNLFDENFQHIELGFGDTTTDSDGNFVSLNAYESLSPTILNDLDEKGYIFPIKYAGKENGVYISKDRTCSSGDFRTIARNRTINKSRRAVRAALLPHVNSPVIVNPSTGYVAASKITAFKNIVDEVLAAMQKAGEISGRGVTIDANQNVLVNDMIKISYSIVPVGVSSSIHVDEGLSLTV